MCSCASNGAGTLLASCSTRRVRLRVYCSTYAQVSDLLAAHDDAPLARRRRRRAIPQDIDQNVRLFSIVHDRNDSYEFFFFFISTDLYA